MSKASDDGLRAKLATLIKQKINELCAAYTRTTGKPANRLGRDVLIKTLAASGADAAPTAKTPTAAKPPRAARAGVSGSAEVAAAQLHPLGVKVCTVLKPKEPRS